MDADQRRRLARLLAQARHMRADAEEIAAYAASRRRSLASIARDPAEPAPQREGACWLLGRVGGRGALAALLAAAADPAPAVRRAAMLALEHLRDGRSLPTIRRIARRDPDDSVRSLAVYALGWFADAPSRALLVRILRDPSLSGDLRSHAAEALHSSRDPRSIPPLLAALRDPEVDVRYSAAYSLASLGRHSRTPRLRRALEETAATDHEVYGGLETVSYQARRSLYFLGWGPDPDAEDG